MSQEIKFKMFKYLHRDGDEAMPFSALVKRQFSEWRQEVKLAKRQERTQNFWPLFSWITAYHYGMFFRPTISSKTSKITLNVQRNDVTIEFRQNPSDLYILRENFVYKIYEFEYEKYIPQIQCIVDLGANIGLSSLFFQSRFPNANIVCVEPVKENIEMLHKNAQNNGFGWKIEKAAIQANIGEVTLYPNEWWSSSTVTESVAEKRQSKDGRLEKILKLPPEQVEALPVEVLLERNHIDRVDILKMDIEGAEEQSILNSKKWLSRVSILIIEIHDKYVNREKIIEVLQREGFVHIPDRQGPTDVYINKGVLS